MMEKNKTVALVLCVLLGYLGIHRFYVGKTKSGLVYLLTVGLCGIGWIVDIVLICTDKFSGLSGSTIVQPPQQFAPQATQSGTAFVYVAASGDGKKYHAYPGCSQSRSKRLPIQKAQALGYTPCQKCNPPLTERTYQTVPQYIQPSVPQPIPQPVQTPLQQTAKQSCIEIPEAINGVSIKYKYTDVKICVIRGQEPDFTNLYARMQTGMPIMLTLVQEPENAYDNNAVAVMDGNSKIGYLYKGQIQEIANRFIKSNYPIFAFISSISNDEIMAFIGFYN